MLNWLGSDVCRSQLPLGSLPQAPPLVALAMRGNHPNLEEEVADQDAMVAVAARESPAHPWVALVKAAALLPQLGPAARQRHHRQSARRSWAPWLGAGATSTLIVSG